jgi:hypothetical protein
MSRFTYYSPLWAGALLAALAVAALVDSPPGPLRSPFSGWPRIMDLAARCLAFGLLCQLVMLGCQGAFAQVLPVPGGRSIRGRGAVTAGGLLLAAIVSAVAAYQIATTELADLGPVLTGNAARSGPMAWVAAGIGAASLLGAAISYVWCLPAAIRDFDSH